MYRIVELLEEHSFEDFERSHFIASVWRLHASPTSPKQNFKSILQIAYLLVRIILKKFILTKKLPKNRVIFVYARYEGSTSLGIIEPVLRHLGRKNTVVLDNFIPANYLPGFDHNSLWHLIASLTLSQSLKCFFKAIDLSKGFAQLVNRNVNFELMYHYFFGLLAFEGMKNSVVAGSGLIVETDATAITRGLVQGCRIAGGTTFCLQHGTMAEHQFPTFVDHYYTWGSYFNKEFLRYQCYNTHTQVRNLGYPRLESLLSGLELDADEDAFDVLVVSNTHGTIFQPYMEDFFACISKMVKSGYRVLVKLHPAEDKNSYDAQLEKSISAQLHFIRNEKTLLSAATMARCAFMIDSAAVMEILALNKPLLFLRSNRCSYPDFGCGLWVSSRDVAEKIETLKLEKEKAQVLQGQQDYFQNLVSNFGQGIHFIADDIMKRIGW